MSLAERYERGDYLEQVPDWHAGDAPWKAAKVLRLLARNRCAPETVCDVGCGAGAVLTEMQRGLPATIRFTGWDIAPAALALCKPKENERLRFHLGDALRDTGEVFDLVLALDVVEHIGDYLGFLEALRARGRRFVFHIPLDVSAQTVARGSDYMMMMRERYGHLHYFTAPAALATLASTGYRVLDSFYTWDVEMSPAPARRPLRALARRLERAAFACSPARVAAVRPHYNLMILAEPRQGS
jgi:SAM-dependent methyltransferase